MCPPIFITRSKIQKYQIGFTLIELIVVIAILAISTTLAAPSLQSFVQKNRAISSTNRLNSLLRLARSEALKRSTFISLCPAQDPTLSACSNTSTWQNGALVFLDAGNSGTLPNGTTPLATMPALDSGVNITAANTTSITYNAIGFVTRGANTSFQLSPATCQGPQVSVLTVLPTGRLMLVQQNCP